jgi:hypothetical protein
MHVCYELKNNRPERSPSPAAGKQRNSNTQCKLNQPDTTASRRKRTTWSQSFLQWTLPSGYCTPVSWQEPTACLCLNSDLGARGEGGGERRRVEKGESVGKGAHAISLVA